MTTYQISIKDTYVYLIRENISLIKRLIDNVDRRSIPINSSNMPNFYKSRAQYLQTMMLLGVTVEHLLKLILLKRDFSIFEVDYIKKVKNKSKIRYADKAISFSKAASLFKNSNPNDYFRGVKVYEFNTHDDINCEYSLGYKRISPRTCITLLQKIRNNYIHKADSYDEWNGIIWYVYNFIVWLAKKEFKDSFSEYEYIGNDDIKALFPI